MVAPTDNRGVVMKHAWMVGAWLLAASGTVVAAQKCPRIETSMVEKGFSEINKYISEQNMATKTADG